VLPYRSAADTDRSGGHRPRYSLPLRRIPFEEPAEIRGTGFIRYRYIDPDLDDNSWSFMPVEEMVTENALPAPKSSTFAAKPKAESGSRLFTNVTPEHPL